MAAFDEFDLSFLKPIPVNTARGEVPVYIEAMCSQRDELIRFMDSEGIQLRPFPPSLHTSDYLDASGEFPNSDLFSQQGMYLPCGPDQPLENVDFVVDTLNVSHAVVTTSGSTALLLALMALVIGKSEEVILPDRDWVASADAHRCIVLCLAPSGLSYPRTSTSRPAA